MAEAHSASTIPVVKDLDEGKDKFHDVIKAWKRSLIRKLCRTKNSINNGMWPTSIYNLALTVLLANFLLLMDYKWAKPLTHLLWKFEDYIGFVKDFPYYIRVFLLTVCFGLIFFVVLMFVRRYALCVLLSYRGWLYEKPHSQSYRTIGWALLVRMISGYSPSLYSCQASLPKMPVPPLRQTLRRLMDSMRPLDCNQEGSTDTMARIVQQSKEFERTLGTKLQKILILKSWLSQNYVTDWWEKYVYLMNRSPLPINSNYYCLDHAYHRPTHLQCARAGTVMHLVAKFFKLLYREQINPLLIRNTIPLCMAQYDRMFCSCRIPCLETDEIKHYDPLKYKHIVVHRKGVFYVLNLMDRNGRIYPPSFLEHQFEWIIDDAEHSKDSDGYVPNLSCLSSWDRDNWAKIRTKHFVQTGSTNQTSLAWIQTAIVYVSLEDEGSLGLSRRAQIGLSSPHIWADKTISFLILDNGKISIGAEHSWADAPVVGHLLESLYTAEVALPRRLYDEEGHCVDVSGCFVPRDRSEPQRLPWLVSDELKEAIETARIFCKKNSDDVDLVVLDFRAFGKGFVKTCRVSPDAFIQMALQLAYFRMHGKFALTYEASMTRLYRCGRTETVRSLTQETADFVLSMVADKVDRGLKIRLLRRACDYHQFLYREAMAGAGIDRHLFALFVIGRGLGYDCDFLKEMLSVPWTLSTSQQPQQQITYTINCDLPEYKDCVSPGGGFGPVSDLGYGVSYMIPGDFKFFFHISSKHSAPDTDSREFGTHLFQALENMKQLFDAPLEMN